MRRAPLAQLTIADSQAHRLYILAYQLLLGVSFPPPHTVSTNANYFISFRGSDCHLRPWPNSSHTCWGYLSPVGGFSGYPLCSLLVRPRENDSMESQQGTRRDSESVWGGWDSTSHSVDGDEDLLREHCGMNTVIFSPLRVESLMAEITSI